MSFTHLAKRFVTSLAPIPVSRTDSDWAEGLLLEGELALWRRMSRPDRRHSIGVARRVDAMLGPAATRPVLAAALLHDVGKVAAGLGTIGRVPATLAGMAAGRSMALAWSHGRGFTRATGLYLRHDEIGADMLAIAGSDPLTAAWARDHHRPPEQWTVPAEVGEALKEADDD